MNKNISKFLKGFSHAGRGVVVGFNGRNMRFHAFMATLVVCLGVLVELSSFEWLIVIILIGLVMTAELINTSIEELANIIRDKNKLDYLATKTVRDLAAGSVLMMAVISAVVGFIIFYPKLLR